MPEAKISLIPGTTNKELVVAFPNFERPGRAIDARNYSTDEQKTAAMVWLMSKLKDLGIDRDGNEVRKELDLGKIIKW